MLHCNIVWHIAPMLDVHERLGRAQDDRITIQGADSRNFLTVDASCLAKVEPGTFKAEPDTSPARA